MAIEVPKAALPHLFRAVQIAALGGACALLWNAGYGLAVGMPARSSLQLDGAGPPRASAELTQYQVIDGRNLFHAREAEKAAPVEAPLEPSRLQVLLLGTVVRKAPAHSMGMLRDPSTNKVVVVHVGDAIAAGQAKVVRIEHRRMVIEYGGRLEAVEFEQSSPARTAAARRGGGSPLNAARARASARSRAEDAASEQLKERMMGRAGRLNIAGRTGASAAAPAAGAALPLAAARVPALAPGSPLQAAGLSPGDRIVAVNGVSLSDLGASPELVALLSDGEPKLVDLERGSSRTQVNLDGARVQELFRLLRVVP